MEDAAVSDQERVLSPSGKKETSLMAGFLSERNISPDLIISSHATRAFETAVILAESLGYQRHEILIESKVYHNTGEGLYNLIFALPDDKDCVMIVGHNPAITQLLNTFLPARTDYLPTAAVARVVIQTGKWEALPLADKEIDFVMHPAILNNQY